MDARKTDITNDWLETNTGHKFNPFSESPVPDYSLKDLVWGVSRACRYAGQIRDEVDHFSVAEHTVLLTRWVWATRYGSQPFHQLTYDERKDLRTAAGHDLGEGLLTDMVRPIKKQMPEYRLVAGKFDEKLARRYDLHLLMPDWLREADNRILRDERAQVMNPSANRWGQDGLEPLGVEVNFWSPRTAYFFLSQLLRALRFDGADQL